eukprot:gb/GECG01007782.1/.p1 GENE.gb/GECG01007782.1/~~gb/GECG01007782.1/.p1  ORF type:complete len:186 (+),score=14.62 gb/GECG01007782.1/:1-558(+)
MYTSRRLYFFRLTPRTATGETSTSPSSSTESVIFPVKVYILRKHYSELKPDSQDFVEQLRGLINRNPRATFPPEAKGADEDDEKFPAPDLREPSSRGRGSSHKPRGTLGSSSLTHCGFVTQNRVFKDTPYLYSPPLVCEFEMRDNIMPCEVVDLGVLEESGQEATNNSRGKTHCPMAKKNTLFVH